MHLDEQTNEVLLFYNLILAHNIFYERLKRIFEEYLEKNKEDFISNYSRVAREIKRKEELLRPYYL